MWGLQRADSTAVAHPLFSGPHPAFQAALSQPKMPQPLEQPLTSNRKTDRPRGGNRATKTQSQARIGGWSHETPVERGPKETTRTAQRQQTAAAPSTRQGVAQRTGRRGQGCVEKDGAHTGPPRVLWRGPLRSRHMVKLKLHSLHRPFLAFHSLKKPPKRKKAWASQCRGQAAGCWPARPRPLPGPSG